MIHKGITTLNQRSPAQRSATRKGKVLCLAVGVIISLMVFPYSFQPIILLRITPAANRNSYRVAMLVGQLPRVAVFARNPGLGKRNSYRVAAAYGLPAYSCFCTGDSRTFFTAKGGLFVFAAFQGCALCVCGCRQCRREHALGHSPPPPSAPACWQAENPQKQKVRLWR